MKTRPQKQPLFGSAQTIRDVTRTVCERILYSVLPQVVDSFDTLWSIALLIGQKVPTPSANEVHEMLSRCLTTWNGQPSHLQIEIRDMEWFLAVVASAQHLVGKLLQGDHVASSREAQICVRHYINNLGYSNLKPRSATKFGWSHIVYMISGEVLYEIQRGMPAIPMALIEQSEWTNTTRSQSTQHIKTNETNPHSLSMTYSVFEGATLHDNVPVGELRSFRERATQGVYHIFQEDTDRKLLWILGSKKFFQQRQTDRFRLFSYMLRRVGSSLNMQQLYTEGMGKPNLGRKSEMTRIVWQFFWKLNKGMNTLPGAEEARCNRWFEIDGGVVTIWSELNSLLILPSR